MGNNEKTDRRAGRLDEVVPLVGKLLDELGYPRVNGQKTEDRLEAALSTDGLLANCASFSSKWRNSIDVIRSNRIIVDGDNEVDGMVVLNRILPIQCFSRTDRRSGEFKLRFPFAVMVRESGVSEYRQLVCTAVQIRNRLFELDCWAPWGLAGRTVTLGPGDEIVRLSVPEALGAVTGLTGDDSAELAKAFGVNPEYGEWLVPAGPSMDGVSAHWAGSVWTVDGIHEALYRACLETMSRWDTTVPRGSLRSA